MRVYKKLSDSLPCIKRCVILPGACLGESYYCDKVIFLDRKNCLGVLKNSAGQLQITFVKYSDFRLLKTLVRSTKRYAMKSGCSVIFFAGDNQDISRDLKASLKTLGFKEYVSPYNRGRLSFLQIDLTGDLNGGFIW